MDFHSNQNTSVRSDVSGSGKDQLASDIGDKPSHLLKLLATYEVSKESGIEYPIDGVRKLVKWEKTYGIKSRDIQLVLDRQSMMIIDNRTRVGRTEKLISRVEYTSKFSSIF